MKHLLLLGLALLLLTGCDEQVIRETNQENILSPTLLGTNSAGTKLYRILIHNGNGESDYFYYWDK